MEKNEILVFTADVATAIPGLSTERGTQGYLEELRSLAGERISCHRVCATLLDNRLQMPWDQYEASSLLFPLVRTRRQFLGKCSLLGMPRDIAGHVWTLHRLCLGTFLPPSEMEDPDLHRTLCSFKPYRGHLSGQSLRQLDNRYSPGSYFALLDEKAVGTPKADDVLHVLGVFDGLLADALKASQSSCLYVMLGGID